MPRGIPKNQIKQSEYVPIAQRHSPTTETNKSLEELEKIAQSVSGVNTNPEDWDKLVEDARYLVHLGEMNLWAKADIATEAAESYGRLKELCEEINQNYGYWRILSSVGQAYDKETRDKFLDLTFSHFQVVAGKENRVELLQKAHDEGWTVSRLVREIRPTAGNSTENQDTNVSVNVNEPDETVFIGADASESGDNFSPVAIQTVIEKVGITVDQTVELLNWIAKLDREVAVSIGKSTRPCQEKLSEWVGEILDRPPSGIGVLDLFNVMLVGQGQVLFDENAEEIFSVGK